jgi:hypothetical protein
MLFPQIGLGWGSFGYVPQWVWDGAPVTLPANAPLGGVQLDIDPRRAQVYVDGVYTGLVSDFSGYYHHLDLVAGPHVVTIVAADYEPLVLQLTVSPGRTLTHRATLMRAYGR